MAEVKEVGFRIVVQGTDEQIAAMEDMNGALKGFADERKRIDKLFKDGKLTNEQYIKSLTQLDQATRNTRKSKATLNKEIEKEVSKTKEMKGSYVQLNRELGEARKAYKNLTQAEREGAKGKAMLKKIQSMDANLKSIDKGMGQYQRNVGNYGGAVEGLASQFGLLNGNVGQIVQSFKLLTGATRAQAVATGGASAAAKILKVALISTGIGAIVVALGSLITYLTQTKKGMEFVERATATMGAVFDVFKDRVSAIGETLFNAFSNPKQAVLDLFETIKTNLINRVQAIPKIFSAVGKAIKEGLSGNFKEAGEAAKEAGQAFIQFGTGLDTEQQAAFIDGIKELNKEVTTEAKLANDLVAAQQKLRNSENALLVLNAERLKQVAELKLAAEDQTKTDEERLAAADKAIALQKAVLNSEMALAQERARIHGEQIAMGESTQEDLDKQAQLEAEVANVQRNVLSSLVEINNQRNNLERKITAEHKAEIDKRKKADEDAEKSQLEIKANQNKTAILEIEDRYNKEILAANGNKDKIAQIEKDKQREILNTTRGTLAGVLQELEGQLLTASLADIIMSDEDRAALELRIAQVRAQMSGLAVDLDNVNRNDDGEKEDLLAKLGMKEENVETAMIAMQNVTDILGVVGDIMAQKSQEKIQNIENERQAEIDHVNNTIKNEEERNTKITDINTKYDAKKAAVDKKEKQRQKKQALITAAINGAMAIMQAIANYGPPPSPPGIAGIAAAVAMTVANIAAISAKKYEAGGMITGPSHSQGGVPFTVGGHAGFEAEGGEYIINKNAVDALGTPYLDSINSIGRPTRTGTHGHFASGGRVNTPTISIPPGVQQTSAVIQQSNADLVEALDGRIDRLQVMVSESDITSTQAKVAEVEETVSFG